MLPTVFRETGLPLSAAHCAYLSVSDSAKITGQYSEAGHWGWTGEAIFSSVAFSSGGDKYVVQHFDLADTEPSGRLR
jgi:hypothetical protein